MRTILQRMVDDLMIADNSKSTAQMRRDFNGRLRKTPQLAKDKSRRHLNVGKLQTFG